MRLKSFVVVGTLASAIGVCGVVMADEPTEAQMKEACDAPTPRGYNCGFD